MTVDHEQHSTIITEQVQEDETAKTEANSEKPEEKPEWLDLLGSGSILKKLIKEGEPDTRPERQQTCTINYELTLPDGTFIEKNENFHLQLGDCEVVQGLDVALGLMNVGEKCILKIDARLAFGALGLQPHIPSNSTVIYNVELLEVTPDADTDSLSLSDRKVKGNQKRERGNWWYGRGENTIAIQCYRRALDYLDEVEGGSYDNEKQAEVTDSVLQDLLEDRVSVCNNMAAAQIKLELYEPALNSLQTVLRCQPSNVKALFRKAKIHRAKNDTIEALKCLKKANEASPNNADVQKEIASITKLMQQQKQKEIELAKRMFGDQKPIANNNAKKSSKNNLLVWSATVAASFAVGLAGLAAYRLKFT